MGKTESFLPNLNTGVHERFMAALKTKLNEMQELGEISVEEVVEKLAEGEIKDVRFISNDPEIDALTFAKSKKN